MHDQSLTVQKLQGLKLGKIMEVFSTLPAPGFFEMNGEYKANLMDHGNFLNNMASNLLIGTSLFDGVWLCKCFTPESGTQGWGYNSFRKSGRVVRKYPMKTSIVKSRFDGRDVFQLYYPGFKSRIGAINMVDEVRKVNDNLYLGVGTWGFTKKQRMIPLPFTLSGPPEPFVGVDKPLKHAEQLT
ncbi:MAG: hypothetical protein JEZ02_17885 [Desulfatibacillum sp.]|nr:hypothetical protein [Desulfatibacillum sp.]